jgi:hypothetical protein
VKYVVVISVLLLAGSASSNAQQAGLVFDAKSGCAAENTWHEMYDGKIEWTGGCRDGRLEGRGAVQWFKDGKPAVREEGEWHSGKVQGRKLSIYASGERIEGEYLNGKLNGRGILTMPNGDRFDANFKDGDASALMLVRYANGDVYEGNTWKKLPHGAGTLRRNGDSFTGRWESGCLLAANSTAGRGAAVGKSEAECGL